MNQSSKKWTQMEYMFSSNTYPSIDVCKLKKVAAKTYTILSPSRTNFEHQGQVTTWQNDSKIKEDQNSKSWNRGKEKV